MNGRKIGYWVTTGLVGFAFVSGGAMDMSRSAEVLAVFDHLGYPPYLATMIGVWKVLGGVAILAPKLPRVKEWAYAGIVFDLTGAIVSHFASGDGVKEVVPILVLLALTAASWALRPESRMLRASPAGAAEAKPAPQPEAQST